MCSALGMVSIILLLLLFLTYDLMGSKNISPVNHSMTFSKDALNHLALA